MDEELLKKQEIRVLQSAIMRACNEAVRHSDAGRFAEADAALDNALQLRAQRQKLQGINPLAGLPKPNPQLG